ncbi:MAG: flagellar filament capping protein FliD [Acidaminobacteraceae bacterium]
MAVTRLTGLVSGLDTDKLIKDLTQTDQLRIDNAKGEKQILSWRQEAYREITTIMDGFKSEHFDLLNPKTNITSKTMFSEFSSSITASGAEVTAVTATGGTSIVDLTHTITSISQLATSDKYTSSDLGFNEILSGSFDINTMPAEFKVSLSVDGVAKTMNFLKADMVTQDIDGFLDSLQTEITDKFGADYTDMASISGGDKIKLEKAGAKISVLEIAGFEDSLSSLGIDSGASTNSYSTGNIGDLLGVVEADLADMSIDGKSFVDLGITVDSTIGDLISAVNTSSVNAEISFNILSDKFEIASTKFGSVNNLDLSAKFSEKLKFDTGVRDIAKNAILVLDGETVVKSSNAFSIGGVSYALNDVYAGDPIDIEITRDTDAIYTKIETFVTDYNNIIKVINDKIEEKSYRSYQPLTDEERSALSEDEVKAWDLKSKSGLLKNDNVLSSMLSSMRSALYATVEGAGVSLYDIGITTSTEYSDNGKLVINENKLKESLTSDFDSVVKLFTSESDKDYFDGDNKQERYRENGLGNRILDIVNNNFRISRDVNGNKGAIIEKAGIPNDSSSTSNALARSISKYDLKIDNLLDYLTSQESRYYTMFSRMESALSEMQNQSNSLMSQLG